MQDIENRKKKAEELRNRRIILNETTDKLVIQTIWLILLEELFHNPIEDWFLEACGEIERLRDATSDLLSGWRYIRENHGELYGVGWDRAEEKALKALKCGDQL